MVRHIISTLQSVYAKRRKRAYPKGVELVRMPFIGRTRYKGGDGIEYVPRFFAEGDEIGKAMFYIGFDEEWDWPLYEDIREWTTIARFKKSPVLWT